MNDQPKSSHVVMDARTQELWCQHCGARERLELPAPILDVVWRMDEFSRRHAGCPRPGLVS